jgi:hypothetical protein
MAVISGSTATLAEGAAGSWWTPAESTIAVDVDNSAMVQIYTRRSNTDTAPKPLFLGDQTSTILRGPCSMIVQVVVGRDYRFQATSGAPIVAAQE